MMTKDQEKMINRMSMLELWAYLRGKLNCADQVWRATTMKALKKGVITKEIIRADIRGDTEALQKSLESLKKPPMKFYEEWVTAYIDELFAEEGVTSEMIESRINPDYDGNLDISTYKQLPQRVDAGTTITYTGLSIDHRSGMRQFTVMAIWQCDELEKHGEPQMIYTGFCTTHSTPSLHDLKKAIHFSITSPSGVQCGSDQPHRPRYITIHNRWTRDCFFMVKNFLLEAGIAPIFQTREEAEKECADAGTDPDELDFMIA